MKFQKGDIVKVIEDVGLFVEKGAIGRVKEVDGSGCLIEAVEGYEEILGGKQRYVSESHIELHEGDNTMRKKQLYFDARRAIKSKLEILNMKVLQEDGYLKCHGLTQESIIKNYGYQWVSDMFTAEKPKPLKIIDGRVE